MIRIKCTECTKLFRVHSLNVKECRSCYKKLYGASRPIVSRARKIRINRKAPKLTLVPKSKRASN